MRLLAMFCGSASMLVAGAASACLPVPPPYWPTLLSEDGPPVFVGRVLSVTPNAELRDDPLFEVAEATAEIDVLESLQGAVSNPFAYTAATHVRLRPGQPLYEGWCGAVMTVKPGDLVLVVNARWGTSVFSPDQVPADFRDRILVHQ